MNHDGSILRRMSRDGLWPLPPLGCLLLLLGWSVCGWGQEPAPGKGASVITSMNEFWAAESGTVHPVELEFVITVYDPFWKVMWVLEKESGHYFPLYKNNSNFPFRTGQRVRLKGTVRPSRGFASDEVKVTILENNDPPPPKRVAGRLDDAEAFNSQWVEFEGTVERQEETDPVHILYQVLSEGRLVKVWLMLENNGPVPQLKGARVRIQGLYNASPSPDKKELNIECWVTRRQDIQVQGWSGQDERFGLPQTWVERLRFAPGDSWTRVVGEVVALVAGKSITVRDETGQMVIQTQQPLSLSPGDRVEIIGHPAVNGVDQTLRDPLVRPAGRPQGNADSGSVTRKPTLQFRLAEQILQLSAEEAGTEFPVTLWGVVLWSDAHVPYYYLQDSSGAVRVQSAPGLEPPPVGSVVSVTGVTARGHYAPSVAGRTFNVEGQMTIPSAHSLSLDQALTGGEESQWVEMLGYLREVRLENDWTRLSLTTGSGEYTAQMPRDESLRKLQGSMVRVSGICTALTAPNGELTGITLLVPGPEAVRLAAAAPADLFATPVQPIAKLRQFTVLTGVDHWEQVSGTVRQSRPGQFFYLEDESGGLLVLTREFDLPQPGDWLDVAGIPGRAGSRLVLREATWRRRAAGNPLPPRSLEAESALDLASDSRLVSLRATLREVVMEGSVAHLTLQRSGKLFEGILPLTAGWQAPENGSLVGLTGVYVLVFDENRQPHGFRMEMREPADLVLIQAPPWWNPRHAMYVAGALIIGSLLFIVWVGALRRQVQSQTRQIRRQVETEARLQTELERSTRLESLGVLAGGIAHDFNNLLTAILGNLGLAAMDKRVMAAAGENISEAERGARRAKDITQQLLTFAKGGDPVRTSVFLPDVVGEAANFARHGSKVRLDFAYPPDLPPGNVDAGQISRVVHNLVINAVQAMPDGGVIKMTLVPVILGTGELDTLAAGAYLKLTIADTGKGIPAENLAKIFDPYFSTKAKADNSGLGLATVRSIIKKHHGHIEVESRVGQGTTFRIWLPAAREEVARVTTSTAWAQGRGPARVLVMDDEDVIRRVAGRMLSLAGHETVFAADGAEAVRAYTTVRKSQQPFDFVIFDLTVPGGMGGKDALQELLKTDPGIRAIASSGYSNDPVMANPGSFGFCATLPKPYDIPDLMKAVEEARRK